MKRFFEIVPKWYVYGLLISIALFMFSIPAIDKQMKSVQDNEYEICEALITDVKYSSSYYTVANIIENGNEGTVSLPDTNYNIGDTIKIYKYNNKYYYNTNLIALSKSPLFFIIFGLSLGGFFFFVAQIFFSYSDNKNK